MARQNPLRIVSRGGLFPSLTRLDWFALYLATASVLLFAISMVITSPGPAAAEAQSWLHGPRRETLLNLLLMYFLGFEIFLLVWLWVEFPRRRRTESALRKIHSLQRAIARSSARVVSLAPSEVEQGLQGELAGIREMLGVERICWYQQSPDGAQFMRQQTASVTLDVPGRDTFTPANHPWLANVISRGLPVHVRSMDEMPSGARAEWLGMEHAGMKSFAVVPSSGGTGAANALMLTSFTKEIDWDVEVVAQLSVLASVFANAQARKVAQDAGVESELRFRHLFEEAPVGCCLTDSNGVLCVANAALKRMLGYSGEELIGKGFWEITAPEDIDKSTVYFKELMSGVRDYYQLEKRYLRKDGGLIWGRLTVSLLGPRSECGQFVLSMIEDVTEAVKAREQLEQSRRRLTMALEASRMTAWEYDPQSEMISWVDRNTLKQGHHPTRPVKFADVLTYVHPDDRERLLELPARITGEGGAFSTEFRMYGRDGSIRWMLGKGELVRRRRDGGQAIAGVTIDVSELKLTQIELAHLAKRLMEAQEEERKRISRELHDDIGQRVALLAIELDLVRQMLVEQPPLQQRVERAQNTTDELGTDLHQLSHALHSSKLQYLGLPAALRELCTRIGNKHALAVELQCSEQKMTLAEDYALALFRVTQEALNNVVRHSQATKAKVMLSSGPSEVRLVISDDGNGFHPAERHGGIGLIGMRERLRSVGGTLEILSAPNCGTEIHATVSLQDRAIAANAAPATFSVKQ